MQSNLVPDHVVSHAIATANEKELQISMILSAAPPGQQKQKDLHCRSMFNINSTCSTLYKNLNVATIQPNSSFLKL